MQKLLRWWPIPALVLLGVGGWAALTVDHERQVADALLFRNGSIDGKAVAGALAARFPNGSSAGDLRRFVGGLGGTCVEAPADPALKHCAGIGAGTPRCVGVPNDALYCSVMLRGTPCVGKWLELKAGLSPSGGLSGLSGSTTTRTC